MDRWGHRTVTSGQDEVIVHWPLPSDCTLVRVRGEAHWVTVTAVPLSHMVAWEIGGYVIPLLDPDGNVDAEVVWDQGVPKGDTDLEFELSDTADTEPVFEPGTQISEVLHGFDVNAPERIFRRREHGGIAKWANGTYEATGDTWFANGWTKFGVGKRYRVRRESAVIFGFSNPDFAGDTPNVEILPGGQTYEWAMLKYIDDTRRDVIRWLLGLSSEGTGTFGLDEAENFMEKLVSDFSYVDDGAVWDSMQFNISTISTAIIRVPGTIANMGMIRAD